MNGGRYRLVVYTLAGLILGFLVLHPYAMLVQWMAPPHLSGQTGNGGSGWIYHLFDPMMLPMGIAFALFGAVIGFLAASGTELDRKLLLSQHEKEKGQIALKTVHNLMVTLSHYLLNANMIIGGKVRHCRKVTADRDMLASLKVIEEQGKKIDAVLKSLRNLVEINTSGYTSDGLVAMIDISRELEEKLSAAEVHQS